MSQAIAHLRTRMHHLHELHKFRGHFTRICLLFSLLITNGAAVSAQIEERTSPDELLENFFRDNDQASESDAQIFLENLEYRRTHPLNLNTASREDLTALGLLNELQVNNLIQYRTLLGPLLNLYELQAVPAWNTDDIRTIAAFATVDGSLNSRATPLRKGLLRGENELLLRVGFSTPPVYGDADVEGGPLGSAVRFKHSFDNRLSYGFTAESDPGEALFAGSNTRGFDFYSGHIYIKNPEGKIRNLALGDYSARWGQGLLLQTGFSPGKSAESIAVMRGGKTLNGYSAFGENFFFRGASIIYAPAKNLEINLLASYQRRDGNIISAIDTLETDQGEGYFTSFQSSGLHRTEPEIADENALQETIAGASVAWNAAYGRIAFNALNIRFDKPFQPSPAPYRLFTFSGKELTAFSLDYQWRSKNWLLFGETARSDNGGMATTNGLLLGPDRRVTLAALYRNFEKDYHAIYAAPFGEASGASNERGLYLGTEIRPSKPWQINLYGDVWQHPWLRFGVSAPSRGSEYLARVMWTRRKVMSAYFLCQLETKQKDGIIDQHPALVNQMRTRFRLHAVYKVSSQLELRSRIEFMQNRVEGQQRANGYLAYQEVVFKKLGFPLSGSLRYAIFDTDNYDTRVFAFENDIFSAVSIPAFAGRGVRYFLNLSWRINDNLRLEARVAETFLHKKVTESDQALRETFYKFQLRWKF